LENRCVFLALDRFMIANTVWVSEFCGGRVMKRVLCACVSLAGLAALSGAAVSADLPRRYDPIVPKAPSYAPGYNWSGLYVGANSAEAAGAVGGGLEFAIVANWTAKAEYLYVDLSKFNCGLSCGAAVTDNVSFRSNIFRGGVNFRF